MFALSVDFFSMGTIKPVVNNVGTHALDSIIMYSDASSEHSNDDLPTYVESFIFICINRVTWGSAAPLREKLCIFVSITCRCIIVH